jgi:isocitrate/isopropylmalate dehydrogenase
MKLLVLPGDGIGPEITQATLAVLEAADRRFKTSLTFETRDIGFAALAKHGTTCPEDVLARAREVDGIILGPSRISITRRATRAASTSRRHSASSSTSMPTCGRRARVRASGAPAGRWIW